MDIENFRDYCLKMDGVTEKTPFGKFSKRFESLLVFYVEGHMFCFADIDDFSSVTVKSTPEKIDELRLTRLSVSNPLNLSSRYWIKLDLGGDITDDEVLDLVELAYCIVKDKYSPKTQRAHKR